MSEVMESCSAVCNHSKLSGVVFWSSVSQHALLGLSCVWAERPKGAPQANVASLALNSKHLLEFKDADQRGKVSSSL